MSTAEDLYVIRKGSHYEAIFFFGTGFRLPIPQNTVGNWSQITNWTTCVTEARLWVCKNSAWDKHYSFSFLSFFFLRKLSDLRFLFFFCFPFASGVFSGSGAGEVSAAAFGAMTSVEPLPLDFWEGCSWIVQSGYSEETCYVRQSTWI